MADIAIKMGVNAPQEDVDGVLRVLEIIADHVPEDENKVFSFGAYEENFSDGAIGVLASMSFIVNYTGRDGAPKTYSEHVMRSFERTVEDGKPAFYITVSPRARELVKVVFKQRDLEGDEDARSRYVQRAVEKIGLA